MSTTQNVRFLNCLEKGVFILFICLILSISISNKALSSQCIGLLSYEIKLSLYFESYLLMVLYKVVTEILKLFYLLVCQREVDTIQTHVD